MPVPWMEKTAIAASGPVGGVDPQQVQVRVDRGVLAPAGRAATRRRRRCGRRRPATGCGSGPTPRGCRTRGGPARGVVTASRTAPAIRATSQDVNAGSKPGLVGREPVHQRVAVELPRPGVGVRRADEQPGQRDVEIGARLRDQVLEHGRAGEQVVLDERQRRASRRAGAGRGSAAACGTRARCARCASARPSACPAAA